MIYISNMANVLEGCKLCCILVYSFNEYGVNHISVCYFSHILIILFCVSWVKHAKGISSCTNFIWFIVHSLCLIKVEPLYRPDVTTLTQSWSCIPNWRRNNCKCQSFSSLWNCFCNKIHQYYLKSFTNSCLIHELV